MKKNILLLFLLLISIFVIGQNLSNTEKQDINNSFQKLERQITTISNRNIHLEINNKRFKYKLDSLRNKVNNLSENVKNSNDTINILKNKLDSIDIYSRNGYDNLSNKNSILLLSIISLSLLLILAWRLSYTYINKIKIASNLKIEEINNNLASQLLKLDTSFIKVLENQIILIRKDNILSENKSPDFNHTLPLKVGDEIHRMMKRIENMPKETKGLTALNNSINRLVDEFKDAGYEFENLLGRKYIDGMKLEARFIDNPDIPKGEEIITDVLKPQINFQGVVIQTAKVEVSKSY